MLSLGYKLQHYELRVTCRLGQVISMAMDYYAWPGWEGVGGVVKYEFFLCFFFFIFISLKTSPEGYIIYRIVNCVSVI